MPREVETAQVYVNIAGAGDKWVSVSPPKGTKHLNFRVGSRLHVHGQKGRKKNFKITAIRVHPESAREIYDVV